MEVKISGFHFFFPFLLNLFSHTPQIINKDIGNPNKAPPNIDNHILPGIENVCRLARVRACVCICMCVRMRAKFSVIIINLQ